MEILFILIALALASVALILAIVALAKPSLSGAEIWKIKHTMQQLQAQIDEFKNRFPDSLPSDQAEQRTAKESDPTEPVQACWYPSRKLRHRSNTANRKKHRSLLRPYPKTVSRKNPSSFPIKGKPQTLTPSQANLPTPNRLSLNGSPQSSVPKRLCQPEWTPSPLK